MDQLLHLSCELRQAWLNPPINRFSRTVILLRIIRPSWIKEIPRRAILYAGTFTMFCPSKITFPRLGVRIPEIVRSRVVLPAPLAPIKAAISPVRASKSMLFRTCIAP